MKNFVCHLLFKLAALIALLTTMVSCDSVLQYPDGPGIDPTLIKMRIDMEVDFSPINDPLIVSYAGSRAGDYDVRYQVAVYARSGAKAGQLVLRKVWIEEEIQPAQTTVSTEVSLHAELYDVYGWIDFVPKGTDGDHHYITDDLRTVHLAEPNVPASDARDAFSGKKSVDLTPYRDKRFAEIVIPLPMERPFGKFKIQATDVKKFLDSYKPLGTYTDIMPSECTVRYNCYFPTAYNQDTRLAHVDEFRTDVHHANSVNEIEENTATLSSNYVFICNENTTVIADLEIRNSSGQLLATVRGVTIPISRNRLTIVKGEFLTAGVNGGAVIFPEFDGEFNVPI